MEKRREREKESKKEKKKKSFECTRDYLKSLQIY
jgi:hypothetical protein